ELYPLSLHDALPISADNGRGGAGGYINLVTKSPQPRTFVGGEASYGFDQYDSESRRRVTVDGNYAIDDHSAVRLNGLFQDGGVAGRELATNDSWGFAPSLALGLGTDLRALLSYEHVRQDNRPDWGVPGATIP